MKYPKVIGKPSIHYNEEVIKVEYSEGKFMLINLEDFELYKSYSYLNSSKRLRFNQIYKDLIRVFYNNYPKIIYIYKNEVETFVSDNINLSHAISDEDMIKDKIIIYLDKIDNLLDFAMFLKSIDEKCFYKTYKNSSYDNERELLGPDYIYYLKKEVFPIKKIVYGVPIDNGFDTMDIKISG